MNQPTFRSWQTRNTQTEVLS